MDGHRRAGRGRAADADRRGGVRPLPLGHEGRARRGVRPCSRGRNRRSTGDRAAAASTTCGRRCTPSKIVSYAQGYQLMRAAAKTYGWNLNYGGIALMWRGGCIIRSAFPGARFKRSLRARSASLVNLMLDPFFAEQLLRRPSRDWRHVCALAALENGVPAPALPGGACVLRRLPLPSACRPTCCRRSATTSARIPTSASTRPRGEFFHTNWTGRGRRHRRRRL